VSVVNFALISWPRRQHIASPDPVDWDRNVLPSKNGIIQAQEQNGVDPSPTPHLLCYPTVRCNRASSRPLLITGNACDVGTALIRLRTNLKECFQQLDGLASLRTGIHSTCCGFRSFVVISVAMIVLLLAVKPLKLVSRAPTRIFVA